MLGAEMEVRVEEGGEGVLSISVLPPKKSSDVSLCGSKPKRQKSQTTLKYIWNSNMNHKGSFAESEMVDHFKGQFLSIVRVRRVTLHDATLTISNDQSPYFHSSPFPLPVAVPGACRLARIPAMGAQARFFFSSTAPRAAPRPPAR
ncbi:hypothetical protein T05_4481 [Trichinella murrelli]|uniref:Uncharacterized protein n=2 Tax=Trichinella murrelli TaxID=144512 RepID=A0A0V0U9J3_9BILA|nr:hypothetical protein T05_4481 [Trichinella murrelli]